MLAYSLRIKPDGIQPIGSEHFDNHLNILSKILAHCMNAVMKQGLVRNYLPHTAATTMPHGKLLLTESLTKNTRAFNKLICRYDVFDENTYPNRVIRTIISELLSCSEIKPEIRNDLKKTYSSMRDIKTLHGRAIQWNAIHYSGTNIYYRMALIVSRLITDGLLLNKNGVRNTMRFLNEGEEWRLFEYFVRGYYDVEYHDIYSKRRKIDWASPEDHSEDLLPNMNSDIILESDSKMLIIDTKCYSKNLSDYHGESFHSTNLYQIQSYVTNWNYQNADKKADGMLLYAETENSSFKKTVTLAGNHYRLQTLNLKGAWTDIDLQLRMIAKDYFGV